MKRILALLLSALLLLGNMGCAAVPAEATTEPEQVSGSIIQEGADTPDLWKKLNKGNSEPRTVKAWLPDPYNIFGVSGEFNGSSEWNGVTYDYYVYQVSMTMEEIVDCESLYLYILQKEGFQCVSFEDPNIVSYTGMTKNGSAYAELAVTLVDGEDALGYGGAAIWQFILAVPEDLEFIPGQGSDKVYKGSVRCDTCKGSGRCSYCYGGRSNYGAGMETCVICDGSNVCNICDGKGCW